MTSQKFIRQRKFYMVLPILVFPFVTLIFWALGGGKVSDVHAQPATTRGLNTMLPEAHFKKETDLWDKFALYEQAKRDSQRYEEARRNDPYFVTIALPTDTHDSIPTGDVNTSLGKKNHLSALEASERGVEEKLQELNEHLSRPPKTFSERISERQPLLEQTTSSATPMVTSPEVDRLEQMMVMMQQEGGNDQEMAQMEGVLEKILDIQHPERLQEKYKQESQAELANTFTVEAVGDRNPVAMIQQREPSIPSSSLDSVVMNRPVAFSIESNGFFGLDDPSQTAAPMNAIQAVIHETQTLVAGSTVKMRLTSDVYLAGHLIPKDHFVYGTCTISGERLVITIRSVQSSNSLYPVSLKVYDVDGIEGLFIPGAIERDAAKQAGSQSVQDIQMSSLNPSLTVQAASAGIQATKSLFSKKAKLIKVTVKAGYKILLYDAHETKS
jgi:conjugative transposon TraM protein